MKKARSHEETGLLSRFVPLFRAPERAADLFRSRHVASLSGSLGEFLLLVWGKVSEVVGVESREDGVEEARPRPVDSEGVHVLGFFAKVLPSH